MYRRLGICGLPGLTSLRLRTGLWGAFGCIIVYSIVMIGTLENDANKYSDTHLTAPRFYSSGAECPIPLQFSFGHRNFAN